MPDLPPCTGPDGSLWVNDRSLQRVSATGQHLATSASEDLIGSSVNREDGTCLVIGFYGAMQTGEIVHLGTDGTILWRGPSPPPGGLVHRLLAVNGADGSAWASDIPYKELVHLSAAGVELSVTPGVSGKVSLGPDGSCWVSDTKGTTHVRVDGAVLGAVAALCVSRSRRVGPSSGGWGDEDAGIIWSPISVTLPRTFRPPTPRGRWEPALAEREILSGGYYYYYDQERSILLDAGTGVCWGWSDTGDYVGVTGSGQEWGRYPPWAGAGAPPPSGITWGLNSADGSLYFVSGSKAALLRIARDGTRQQMALGFAPNPSGCMAMASS